jgi:hypothetical protein
LLLYAKLLQALLQQGSRLRPSLQALGAVHDNLQCSRKTAAAD